MASVGEGRTHMLLRLTVFEYTRVEEAGFVSPHSRIVHFHSSAFSAFTCGPISELLRPRGSTRQ